MALLRRPAPHGAGSAGNAIGGRWLVRGGVGALALLLLLNLEARPLLQAADAQAFPPAAAAASSSSPLVAVTARAVGSSSSNFRVVVNATSATGAACADLTTDRFDVAIFVFAWRRIASLKRTLSSLQAAEYCGDRLALTILFDASPLSTAVSVAKGIHWPHGPLNVVVEEQPRGVRGMWTTALSREIEKLPRTTHLLPIEDDLELSPLYYWWLLRAARAYGPFDTPAGPRKASKKLAGIALYSPRLDEIEYPQLLWRPRQACGDAPAFLFQLPCSWGAVYFSASSTRPTLASHPPMAHLSSPRLTSSHGPPLIPSPFKREPPHVSAAPAAPAASSSRLRRVLARLHEVLHAACEAALLQLHAREQAERLQSHA